MTFFRSHQLKASDRKRINVLVQPPRPKPTSPLSGISLPCTEGKGSIETEVERLFQQATDAISCVPTAGSQQSSHGLTRPETPLFLRFMKRRETRMDESKDGLVKNFPHRIRMHSSPPTIRNPVDDKGAQSNTPDFTREESYDSDASCIASPRFSTQSCQSLDAFSPLRMSNSRLAPADEKESEIISNTDANFIVLPPPERRQPNALSISKRRGRCKPHVERSYTPQSLIVADLNSEREAIEKGSVRIGSNRKRSKFTEIFHHAGLEGEALSQSVRKISVGWMSEGKRCGYGYSFVNNNEPIATSCESDFSAQAKVNAPSQDLIIIDSPGKIEGQDRKRVEVSKTDVPFQKDEGSVLKIETLSIPSKPSRWVAFPSHTRVARNKPLNFEDGVIVRDFCTQASPNRPEHHEHCEEKKRDLMTNAIRQGLVDTFLWMMGLGKREIARYHAGLEVQAARAHDCQDPMFEMNVPYWDHVPKEELGDYHIEALKAARRRYKQRHRHATSSNKAAGVHLGGIPGGATVKAQEQSFLGPDDAGKYVGRRHSSTF